MKFKDFFIILFFIFVDQFTKFLMIDKNIVVIPNMLSFEYVINSGGAFGIGNKNIILIVSIVLIDLILILLAKYNKKTEITLPLVLILSGGISNLIDRFFRSNVIDFINIHLFNFPLFNVADILIVFGIIYLLILTYITMKKENCP